MAKRTISTRLAVEGESEYKKGIASCNSELSTLKSNLALTESAFKGQANTISALSAKGDALSAMYEKQKQKVGALEAALANAQAAQAGYSDRVAMAKENIERCEKALETLKDSTGDTSEEQAALTAELEKWNSELEEAKAYQEAAEKGVNGWQKQLNYANVDLNNLSAEIAKNNQYLDEAKKSADGCAKSIDQYGKETEEAANKSKKFGDKSKNAVDSLASALAAAGITATVKEIGQTLLECSDAAARFEAAIAKIATIADTSKMSLEDISSEIITLSGKTAQSSVALSEAVYSAISAGVDTAHAVEFVEKATRLAAGGFTESQTAVDVLTTALNAYGLSVAETERVSDILITTQNLGKTTVNELAASVGKVIPLAAAYGVEMDNLGAAYAVLTANGVATAEAGTYLKAILNELGNSGSTVAKVLKEQTGTSFAGLVANGSSLGDVLDILGQSVEGDATAFNELWSSTEAGVGALSIFNKGADNFNAVLGEMQDSAGATSDAYETMANTTEFARQRMEVATENLKAAIGEQLAPTLNTLYDAGSEAFGWATEFVEENPWVVTAISALVVGIGVLAAGVTVVTAATAAWNAVLLANPAGLVVAGVMALVSALTFLAFSMGSADAETRELTKSIKESKAAYDDLTESMEQERRSTASLVSALKNALETEEKSAAQKEVILAMVADLNEAVPELGLSYDAMSDSINMTAESLDALVESAAKQEEYEAQVARLSELEVEREDINARLAAVQEEYNAALQIGSENIYYLAYSVSQLTQAQAENEEQIKNLEEASSEYGAWQQASAQATNEMTATVNGLVSEIDALQIAYDDSKQKAMESIESQLGLFNSLDGTAKTSIGNLIGTLSGQIEYMDTYAANIQRAMEMGVDEGLVRELSDGSEESAQILAAIVQGGEKEIQALNEKFAQVEEGKEKFSTTVAEMETDFSNKMTDLENRIKETTERLDVSIEAGAAGAATIQGYINGAEGMRGELVAKYDSLAAAANQAYKSRLDINSPSRVFREDGKNSMLGAIEGAEEERPHLEDTYENAAQSAIEAFERGMPSNTIEPSFSAISERQTRAIVNATREAAKNDRKGGFTFAPTYNSPKALSASEMARKSRNDVRAIILKMGGTE